MTLKTKENKLIRIKQKNLLPTPFPLQYSKNKIKIENNKNHDRSNTFNRDSFADMTSFT